MEMTKEHEIVDVLSSENTEFIVRMQKIANTEEIQIEEGNRRNYKNRTAEWGWTQKTTYSA